ncbi:putative disease resistance RPP13-like protein 1 [Camellia sinensis]|uniref:putative disease resistance RPP13-like protein 1 n=1 Tax=Camellia sinensis TaxID=4442 RepID=UPI0010355628|nr:putative disease resistance RPP13-like protein 1 [Camellia sinensis]
MAEETTMERRPAKFPRISNIAPFNFKSGSKLIEITSQLQEVATKGKELGLDKRLVGRMSTDLQQRSQTTCLKEPHIHGRDKDIKQIMELLFGDAPTGTSFDVIPIVGMGGIGKTILTQHIYNHDQVQKHFNLKAWVCVSDDFEVMRITKAILESFTHCSWNFSNLNEVQVQLSKTLAGKKFLLVLDDVWDYGHDGWNLLQSPFGVGAPGSKVIVTTRDRGVAKQMGMDKYHNLHNLSYDDCWLIFSQHAFQNRNIEECQELESIGKKIVENRCRGLPLAARALGSLLCCKQEEREWKAILNSDIWNEESGILPALKLSYLHLPSHLKTCISYCAIIPKDYEFRKTELVLLSMAQGLIEQPKGGEQMKDLGCNIDELPDSIGDLKHLRYLDVSHYGITRLPDIVATLYNLQVLFLKFCRRLQKLSLNMGRLGNLRYFDMTGVHIPSLEEMSLHIGKLTNLQTLPNFMVGKDCGRKIGELKNLSHIRGAIYISRLENVNGVKDARDANLMSKEELKSLSLEWDESHSSQNDIVERDVLDVMRPSKLLERLTINGYGSTKFPNWVGEVSFSKMVFMRLKGRKCCTSLPPLGQLPLLKNLYIEGMSAIKRLGCEFYGQQCGANLSPL